MTSKLRYRVRGVNKACAYGCGCVGVGVCVCVCVLESRGCIPQSHGWKDIGYAKCWIKESLLKRIFPEVWAGCTGFPSSSAVKNLPAMQETQVWSLGQEDPLEKELATHSSILAWRSPWTEEIGGLESTGSQRVGHDWVCMRRLGITSTLLQCIL